MQVKDSSIVAATPASDHSEKEGHFVENSSGSVEVSNSATDLPMGVIVHGEVATGQDSIGLFGIQGTVKVKLAGTVAKHAKLQLHTDGRVVTDAATGARVVVAQALEAGVADELIEAALYGPIPYAS